MAKRPTTTLAPAVRPDLTLSPEEADLSSAAIDTFTIALGGRQALLDTLLVASGSREVDQITTLLIDPRYGGWSLRRICALAGYTVADLFTAYRKALIVKAHLHATRIVSQQLVSVVDDVMRRAQPHEIPCPVCNGATTIVPEPTKESPNPSPEPCPTCKGVGRLLQLPDLDRQKVALELGQLLQTRGGLTLQQNTLVAPAPVAAAAPGALEQLQQAVQELLYPRATATAEPPAAPVTPSATVEGEVVDPDDPD